MRKERICDGSGFKELNYDPDGRGDLWNAVANTEQAKIADKLATEAGNLTKKQFGKNGRSDDSDAFRHAYWSFMMAKKLGVEGAKNIGDGHETASLRSYYQGSDQTDGELLMDLHNNQIGRQLYERYKDSDLPPEKIIMDALNSGQLQTVPFKVRLKR
ncbi:MAG: hypothetical protein HWE30_17995 [Methylocystaceae bacterium]|nr:hypothetical protein [Methylocystaceae bacterium]